MDLATLLAFAAIFAVACASPGPTIAALVARVLGRGLAGAPAFCAGLLLGDLVWLAVAGLGLAVLAQTMQPVFAALKYAGAAYLLWLAWKLWTAPAVPGADAPPVRGEGARLLAAGLAIALGNPKTMLFYLALLPTLVDLAGLPLLGFLELGGVVAAIYAAVLFGYVTLAARAPAVPQRLRHARGQPLDCRGDGRRRSRGGDAVGQTTGAMRACAAAASSIRRCRITAAGAMSRTRSTASLAGIAARE
jgi:threonine/homoserine/homoserine lactone efflux protein